MNEIIDSDRILLPEDFKKDYECTAAHIKNKGICFVFKDDAIDLVVMSVDKYNRVMEIVNDLSKTIDDIEHIEFKNDKGFDKTDNK